MTAIQECKGERVGDKPLISYGKMEYNNRTIQEAVRLVFLASRHKRGLTQNRLSIISNITRQFISQVEGGKRQPSIFTLCALANAYNLSLTAFFEEVDRLYLLLENGNFVFARDILQAAEPSKIANDYLENAKKINASGLCLEEYLGVK